MNEISVVNNDNLLLRAVEQGATPEALEKLVALQERIMAKNAEMEFNRAIQEFQSECPPIDKDRTAEVRKDGKIQYTYKYATLEQIARTIQPLLKKHGLSYSFDSSCVPIGNREVLVAKCTVHHVAGHSRSGTFQCPIDSTARMNVMQQSASALSYARRYALTLALGITTAEYDDDARSMDPPVSVEGLKQLKARWTEKFGGTVKEFEAWVENLTSIPSDKVKHPSSWDHGAYEKCTGALE